MSLREADRAAGAIAKAPRVTLADIEGDVIGKYFALGSEIGDEVKPKEVENSLRTLTVCVLVMRNGFSVIGKSAPASPENFDADLGRRFAYEDCLRQLWPLMGFALREKLAAQPA